MLRGVLLLTQAVIDRKHDWSASPDDVELMYGAASIMGRSLAPETFTSAGAALAFLLMARFTLETIVKTYGSDVG